MGTINYKQSDYITLGVKPYDETEIETDAYFMYEELADDVQAALDEYSFHYYRVTLEPGYYEGFTINIENKFSIFDASESKQLAQKEITQIKQLLIECAGLGLVSCYPGWCSGYDDYGTTLGAIKEAIGEMREEVKQTPTWWQYERETYI